MARFFQLNSPASVTSGSYVTNYPVLYNQTAFSVMLWFNQRAAVGNGTTYWRAASGTGNSVARAEIQVNNTGTMVFNIRTASTNHQITTVGNYLDSVWHRLFCVRRNVSPFMEMYIDGVSVANSTSDPGTDASAIFSWLLGSLNLLNGMGGSLARFAVLGGTSLTVTEAEIFLLTGSYTGKLSQWLELNGQGDVDFDLTGNGFNGIPATVNNTAGGQSVLDGFTPPMVPIGPPAFKSFYTKASRRFAAVASSLKIAILVDSYRRRRI